MESLFGPRVETNSPQVLRKRFQVEKKKSSDNRWNDQKRPAPAPLYSSPVAAPKPKPYVPSEQTMINSSALAASQILQILRRATASKDSLREIAMILNSKTKEELGQIWSAGMSLLNVDLKFEVDLMTRKLPQDVFESESQRERQLKHLRELWNGFDASQRAAQVDDALRDTNPDGFAIELSLLHLKSLQIDYVMDAYTKLQNRAGVALLAALKRQIENEMLLNRIITLLEGINPDEDAKRIFDNPDCVIEILQGKPVDYKHIIRQTFEKKYAVRFFDFIPFEFLPEASIELYGREVMDGVSSLTKMLSQFPTDAPLDAYPIIKTILDLPSSIRKNVEHAFNDFELYDTREYKNLREELAARLPHEDFVDVLRALEERR